MTHIIRARISTLPGFNFEFIVERVWRNTSWTLNNEVSSKHRGWYFINVVSRFIEWTLRYHAKKSEKKPKTVVLTWRNPFTIFRARAASCVSSRMIPREGWKRRIRETGIEKQKSKGWKREHCAACTSICTRRQGGEYTSRAYNPLFI